MSDSDMAMRVENIGKRYRIGMRENIRDNLVSQLIHAIKSPWTNYRKYRSLYRFDDSNNGRGDGRDTIWAVKDVSFEVKQGDVLGIIGRNGAGKSTLLKILCRITDPTQGRAEIHGRVSSLLEVGTGFHDELTGRENIYLNGTILGMTKKEVDSKFEEIVEFSGVSRFIDTPVKRYSSGMKVRLAFSVAAHLEPEILIIDEVLAVGDADFQKKCLDKMDDVGKQGRTVLFVSHNMPAVTRLCKRALLIQEGRLVAEGNAHAVVGQHMNSSLGTRAAREWRDADKAPGGRVARLVAVRVLDEQGNIAETVDIRQPLSVEMEYDVLEPEHVLLPHFGFVTEERVVAFVSVDVDPGWRRKPRPKGRYVSGVRIPGNLLSEGNIFCDAIMMTLNPDEVQFLERSTVSFMVTDSLDGDSARGDYARRLPGALRPLLEWTTQYLHEPNG